MRCAAAVFALIGFGGCDSSEPAARDAELDALLDEWQRVEADAAVRDREDRRAAVGGAQEFVDDVDLSTLYALCAREEPEDRARANAIGSLVVTKLELEPASGHVLASWLGDEALSATCRYRVLRVAQRWRGELDESELNAISEALLAAADHAPGRAEGPDWEISAAQFGTSDAVLERVDRMLGGDEARRLRAIAIARESSDARVANRLLDELRRMSIEVEDYPESAAPLAFAAARLTGGRALLPLERLVVKEGERGREIAVPALGHVEHPRTVELLSLVAEDLPGEPRPDMDAFQREASLRVYDSTRRLESYLAAQLRSSESEEARGAFALLDRAARWGPLVNPERVLRGLEALRVRPGRPVPMPVVDALMERLSR